jgi:flavin-dependent dehydrogenase
MADRGGDCDVAILGGGLAGLTLGLQLKAARPQTSIAIAEQREGPAPEAAFKVGESTVEVSARYFAEVIGMQDHIDAHQLPKAGLRFFWPAGDNSDISKRIELGVGSMPPVHTYQLDRGRFENELAERCRQAGAEVLSGWTVADVELSGDAGHTVTLARADERSTVRARWVVDATGPHGLLKRKLALAKPVEHTINSAWFRLAGGLDPESWSDDERWLGRIQERGLRRLSTNHLMGKGYWVWLIPLASGPVSIGIVADPRFHSFAEIKDFEGALAWLERNEPQLATEVAARRDGVEDFHAIEDFAYSATQVFSAERWALSGVAGTFADPFYSPGSDFIAMSNTFVTDLIVRDLAGEDIGQRAVAVDAQFRTMFESLIGGAYTNQYKLFGNAEVMSAKILFDWMFYWSVVALPFYQGRLIDWDFARMAGPSLGRLIGVRLRVEQLFRDWHELCERDWQDAFITPADFPSLWERLTDLVEPFAEDELIARYAENAERLEALAVVLFHKAAAHLPGQPLPADARVAPAAICLQSERWQQDGLFADDGLTLADARARLPGVERILLDELAVPL